MRSVSESQAEHHPLRTQPKQTPRTTWVTSTRKVKPVWILLEQEMTGWQWHQLDHMQTICTSLQTDSHASTSSLNLSQAGCSSRRPTNSVKALKATY